MNRETLEALTSEFSDKAEELERKLNEITHEIHDAEKSAFERGLAAGLTALERDFEGKTLVITVPADEVEETLTAFSRLSRQFKCKVVVCSDLAEIRDLHELELKAIGLKRLDE